MVDGLEVGSERRAGFDGHDLAVVLPDVVEQAGEELAALGSGCAATFSQNRCDATVIAKPTLKPGGLDWRKSDPSILSYDSPDMPGDLGEVASRDLIDVKNALMLVDVDSLDTYEQPDNSKVAEIVVSLLATKTLFNPVIVDPGRNLLIDGHHRVKAFQWLRLPRIPAYTVDYLSQAVDVGGWSRVINAKTSEVRCAFNLPGGEQEGSWSVVASTSSDVIAQRWFREPEPSAVYLDRFALCHKANGSSLVLEPVGKRLALGYIQSYVDPVIGKPEVLKAVEGKRLFPQEVNRHLVDGRPLQMQIPLDGFASERAFKRTVEGLFNERAPMFIDSGVEQRGRIYEERVTLFKNSTGKG